MWGHTPNPWFVCLTCLDGVLCERLLPVHFTVLKAHPVCFSLCFLLSAVRTSTLTL